MTSTAPTRRPWTKWLQACRPTAAALAIAALLVTPDLQADSLAEGVTALSQAALLLPLEYLVVAKLRRRRASWPVILALFIPFVAMREQDVVDPAVVLSALALVVLVWGAADGQLRRPDPFRIQALGMLGSASARSRWLGWSWIRTWAATWWPPAGSCTGSGT